MKFRVTDPEGLMTAILAEGAVQVGRSRQRDVYFRHPARNFRETDEALRLRCENNQLTLTYKGPALRGVAKIREELEVPLPADQEAMLTLLLERLGFARLCEVEKERTEFRGLPADPTTTIAIDSLAGLGVFAEVERVVEHADLAAVEHALKTLALRLGLETAERKSYLEMKLGLYGIEHSSSD